MKMTLGNVEFDVSFNKEFNSNVARVVGDVPSDEKLRKACEEMECNFGTPVINI